MSAITPTAAGASILTATIHELTNGRWFADIELDTNVAPSGAITIDMGDDVTFLGTVGRSDTTEGTARARVVGGADGLGTLLDAKAYRQVEMGVILDDLASATGETLDGAITDELRAVYTQLWHRSRGSGGNALRAIASYVGADWRFTRAGKLWLGTDTWPELEVDGVEIDDGEGEGWVLYAPNGGPTLQPGYTIDGRRVDAVVTLLRDGSLTQRVLYRKEASTPILDRLRDGLAEIVNALLGRSSDSKARWDYLALYPCTVDAQAGDGTLDLRPDDTVISGSGLSGVPLKTGLPGWTVEVPAGTRVLLGFESGSPALPYALLWEHSEGVTELSFDGGTKAVARVDDGVSVGTIEGIAPAGGGAVTFTHVPADGSPVQVLTKINLNGGQITSGNTKLLA